MHDTKEEQRRVREEELNRSLEKYEISLSTADIAEILNCSHRTAFLLQKHAKLTSFVLNKDSKKKIYKTLKTDLIQYMLTN